MTSGWSSAYAADAPVDSRGHWAQARLSAWLDQGYIQGYEDGSLRPDDSIKRGELFALINRVYGWKEPAAISFADLTNDHWAYAEAAKAVKEYRRV
ncbi:S-layer homology domain-containing protein [Paenibacillus oceani]|uniref:S-layer homology domain-containing protein n=1 Tax=Paenibacillus oceani TaxID=2772510 RepID=A0A927C6Y4_9BACL|nr:S-layer homology domain-containing protein [Paenibacillus oceani]MBD2861278.1 S-layer homology domain-containing protein [Paenibacillus oceani]